MSTLKVTRRKFLGSTALTALAMSASVQTLALAGSDKQTQPKATGEQIAQTWCEMCFWGCGVTAHIQNGKVKKLEGQPLCPNNFGKLCAKGNAGVYQLYDPDRLKTPLIRTGKRGEGKFRKATWEEAYKYIAENTKKTTDEFGSKSLAYIAHGSGEHAMEKLVELIGSKNIAIPSYSQCVGPREIGWFLTYGKPFTGHEYVDAEHSKCMMFLGRNVLEALHVGEAQRVTTGLSRGAKMIYVDPRYTKTASKADHWLMIKPGTDMALVLSMINYLIEQRLYDTEFVSQSCHGFDELKEEVEYATLEWAAQETGISEDIIATATIELAKAAPHCFVHPGRRVTRYGDDTQFVRAVGILNALLGNWEMPGGFFNLTGMKVKTPGICDIDHHKDSDFQRVDGAGTTYPLAPQNLGIEHTLMKNIAEDTAPYPIKALYVYGTNMFQHQPDYDRTKKIIDKLDLLVTCDIYMTETAMYSDVILPESTYLERQDPIKVQSDKNPFVQIREAAIKPIHNTKGAWEIAFDLAKAMKIDSHMKFTPIDEYNKKVCKELGISMKQLKKDGVYVSQGQPYRRAEGQRIGFPTPSKKVELYSDKLASMGFDPVPTYTKLEEVPQNSFRLLFGRMSYHTHARTQNIRWLLALHDFKVEAWIHTDRAKALGIKNGDMVKLKKGKKVSGNLTAKVNDQIHTDAVFIPHGFGRFSKGMPLALEMAGASSADLCSSDTDPISGGAAFHNAFVTVVKA